MKPWLWMLEVSVCAQRPASEADMLPAATTRSCGMLYPSYRLLARWIHQMTASAAPPQSLIPSRSPWHPQTITSLETWYTSRGVGRYQIRQYGLRFADNITCPTNPLLQFLMVVELNAFCRYSGRNSRMGIRKDPRLRSNRP